MTKTNIHKAERYGFVKTRLIACFLVIYSCFCRSKSFTKPRLNKFKRCFSFRTFRTLTFQRAKHQQRYKSSSYKQNRTILERYFIAYLFDYQLVAFVLIKINRSKFYKLNYG